MQQEMICVDDLNGKDSFFDNPSLYKRNIQVCIFQLRFPNIHTTLSLCLDIVWYRLETILTWKVSKINLKNYHCKYSYCTYNQHVKFLFLFNVCIKFQNLFRYSFQICIGWIPIFLGYKVSIIFYSICQNILYSISKTLPCHTFRFDHAMVAFLDCLQEVSL